MASLSSRYLLRSRSIIPKTTMPLKAKLLSTAVTENTAKPVYRMTDMVELCRPVAGDDPDDVMFSKNSGLRIMELNRPKKLNSLNGSMARKLVARLLEYQKSDMANILLLQGVGRALCAGGDVATLAQWNKEGEQGQQRSSDYFALEYKLDHLIASYDKPYVAYMDGITMGGGVGLSVHAPFRIATENTVFAMPETTIGFFPEVGATFFLPRMSGDLGTYLALTSEQLRGVDVFYHGIATHFIHSTSLSALSDRLARLEFPDHTPLDQKYQLINSVLADFDTGLPAPAPQIPAKIRVLIARTFKHDSPLDILNDLERTAGITQDPEVRAWANKTIATIRERSPIGVAVTLKALRLGKKWNIAQAFQNEYAIASVFMRHPDFVTGVTARLIERTKERPKWSPNQLEDVTSLDVDNFFVNIDSKDPLALLATGPSATYEQYPHVHHSLPAEGHIRYVLGQNNGDEEATLKHFLQITKNKIGVKEKVEYVAADYRSPK